MGPRMSQTVCCSVRDKYDRNRSLPNYNVPQFSCTEVDLNLTEPRFAAFAPLWSGEVAATRRLALASSTQLHVYSLAEEGGLRESSSLVPQLDLEYSLSLDTGQGFITAIVFTEETTSRHLAVAFSPLKDVSKGHVIRIFSCDPSPLRSDTPPKDGHVWNFSDTEASIHTLEDHAAPVTRMVISPTYLVTADALGVCCVWQKNRSYLRKGGAPRSGGCLLHKGGVADLAADRLHVYSAGTEDKCVCVWSVPDLELRHSVRVEIPQVLQASLPDEPEDGTSKPTPVAALASMQAPYRLLRVTALRRPLSRWAGSQGSSRHASTPKGTLYVAGVLAATSSGDISVEEDGAGVLMEWSLGLEPSCQCAQIAHDSPIVSLVYGPYDNGPLITADARGMFRVWDTVPRLTCSQQVRITGDLLNESSLAMVVEPHHGLYTTVGDSRLFVWRRSNNNDIEDAS